MKNKWIIACCLILFTAAAYYFEKSSLFIELRETVQEQEVPSGILDYGSMGKALKKTGLIQTIPKKSEYFPIIDQTLIRVFLETNVESNLHIYWAKEKKHYSVAHSTGVPVSVGKNEYLLVVPALNTFDTLRIDPSSETHANITISSIRIERTGFSDIQLNYETGLQYLVPLSGVGNVELNSKGLSFISTNLDPQFEFSLKKLGKIEDIAFLRKRNKTIYSHIPSPGRFEDFPSSKVIDKQSLKKGWPLVSIVIDQDDLYHPDKGIIPNKTFRGRNWERPAYFSYFDENGKNTYASMVGVRIHGGKRVQLYSSFRLYFRKKYGLSRFTEFKPEIKFSSNKVSLKRLVVHHTKWPPGGWVFNNPLAYDISKRIGCVVPETKLTMLFINGIEQGIHFLTPQINDGLLKSYFGHKVSQ